MYMENYHHSFVNEPKEMVTFEIISKRGVPFYPYQIGGGLTGAEQEVVLPRNSKFKVHRVIQAPYEMTYSRAFNQNAGFNGNQRDGYHRELKKKRFTVIQLIDVTDEE